MTLPWTMRSSSSGFSPEACASGMTARIVAENAAPNPLPDMIVPTSINVTSWVCAPISVIATPAAKAGMLNKSVRPAASFREDRTASAALKVRAATTRPPTNGSVAPVATRTRDGISEK